MFQAISATRLEARASMRIIKDLVHIMKTHPYDLNDLLFSNKLDAYRMIEGDFIGVNTIGSVWSEKNSISSNTLNDIKDMDLKPLRDSINPKIKDFVLFGTLDSQK